MADSQDLAFAPREHATNSTLDGLASVSPRVSLRIDERAARAIDEETDAHLGVKKVEAAEKVYGRYSRWILFTSCVSSLLFTPLACICYIIVEVDWVWRRTSTH